MIDSRQLKELTKEGCITENEPLAGHTTFRIGGPADYFATPSDEKEVAEIISLCKKAGLPFFVMGNGSNLLVGDKGFRGLVLSISKKMSACQVEKGTCFGKPAMPPLKGDNHNEEVMGRIHAEAGISLAKLAGEAAREELTGLEFAAGIPGTLGGAVFMNAGAYGGEIKDVLLCARVLLPDGTIRSFSTEELSLGYRHSILMENHGIVLSAEFLLKKGNKEAVYARMKELAGKRMEKQPLEYPSAGSTFKRPEGYFAGKLIMDAGLSGYRVGDAMVSEKHCGFVINAGNATAKEVQTLMQEVSDKVFEASGVRLEPEVRMIGE